MMRKWKVAPTAISVAIAVLLVWTSPAKVMADSPGLSSISASLGMGTEPSDSGLGSGFGFGLGADFYHDGNTEVRGDLGYMNWSSSESDPLLGDVSATYTRLPIILSGRMYLPFSGKANLYVQAGAGFSYDKVTAEITDEFGGSVSESTFNFDLVPAGGVQFSISPVLSLGVEAAYHIVEDPYFALMGRLTYSLKK